MRQLVSRTTRIRRGWLDRVKGLDRLYETKVTDGYREATGTGATPDASERSAHSMWVTKFGQANETAEFHLPSPSPSIAADEALSTSPAQLDEATDAPMTELDEVTDALRAELGEVIDALRAAAVKPSSASNHLDS
jgi:hypothetical protein